MKQTLLIGSCLVLGVAGLVPLARRSARGTAAAVGGAAAVGAFAMWMQRKNEQSEDSLYRPTVDSLAGQTILITGGTTGLGLETAKRLAIGGPKDIVLTARSHSKGQAAVVAVQEYLQEKKVLNDCRISYKLLDLDSLQGIRDAVTSWTEIEGIDVLLNNAGIMAVSDRQLTEDGFERQIQSNHLGHFLLTSLLVPKLKSSAKVINVSSSAYKIPGKSGIDFEYLWKGEPGYGAWKSYGQSKLANIYFSQELQRRAKENGLDWQVASLHPGAVQTDLGRHLIGVEKWEGMKKGDKVGWVQMALLKGLAMFVKTVPEGANTHVYLASGAAPEPWNAQYYSDSKPETLQEVATDAAAAKRLWEESEKLCQIEEFFKAAQPAVGAK